MNHEKKKLNKITKSDIFISYEHLVISDPLKTKDLEQVTSCIVYN